jgi:hypothetical protein
MAPRVILLTDHALIGKARNMRSREIDVGAVRQGVTSMLSERPPSADRSQQILNTAGFYRDSAARLC